MSLHCIALQLGACHAYIIYVYRMCFAGMLMRLLVLFSGTGSVGKVARDMGYDIVNVDRDMPATHQCDIMDYDYKQCPPKYFDVLWASNSCTKVSRALTTRPRDLESDSVR